MEPNRILDARDRILITGANGFLGLKVVEALLSAGFRNLRCAVRSSRSIDRLREMSTPGDAKLDVVQGNLLSQDHCQSIVKDVALIIHLAAGTSKSFAGCFMDSAVTTRNLLDAALGVDTLKRFVSISSLAVYSGIRMKPGALLEEDSPLERDHMERFDPYCFGKIKQDELVMQYGTRGLRYVIVRPGPVYGPGKRALTGRIGTSAFGIYIHVGGSNRLPLIFVDNCADAIICAAIAEGVDGEVFIAVDDELPTSSQLLKLYKKNVRSFASIRIPYMLFFLLSWGWEKYSRWSEGQLPPAFNRRQCATYYQTQRYSNEKLKQRTGWAPRVSFVDACQAYFAFQRAPQDSK